MSKIQSLVTEQAKILFKSPLYLIKEDDRPTWLLNKSTGMNLELDISIHSKNHKGKYNYRPLIAFEVQGQQHFKDTKKFFNHSADKSRENDYKKQIICDQNRVLLIEIFYNEITNTFDLLDKLRSVASSMPEGWRKRRLSYIINDIQLKPKENKLPQCFSMYFNDDAAMRIFRRRISTV